MLEELWSIKVISRLNSRPSTRNDVYFSKI